MDPAAMQQQLLQQLLLQQMMQNPLVMKQVQDLAAAQSGLAGAASASDLAGKGGGKGPVFIAPPDQLPAKIVNNPKYPGQILPYKKYPCKFFLENRCAKGDNCTYLHEGEGAVVGRSTKLCRDFENNTCHRGEACPFSHDPVTATERWTETKESATCSVHGRNRTIDNMVDDGMGGYKCTPGQECKVRVRAPPKRDPDWTCPSCQDLVFASRPECRHCLVPNPAKESAICSVHNCARAMDSLMGDSNVGYVCVWGDCKSWSGTANPLKRQVGELMNSPWDESAEPARKRGPAVYVPPPNTVKTAEFVAPPSFSSGVQERLELQGEAQGEMERIAPFSQSVDFGGLAGI